MRIFLFLVLTSLLAVFLVEAAQEEAEEEEGAGDGEGEAADSETDLTLTRKAQAKGSCSSGDRKPGNPARYFKKWTGQRKTCQCWWDPARSDCACCKNKAYTQCGYPMHKYCWKNSPTRGCPGVCNNAFTLSTRGFPCYSNPANKACAWCAPFAKQCKADGVTGPASRGGSRCTSARNANYCFGVQGDCSHMSGQVCSPYARCLPWKKKGNTEHKQCRCNPGFGGNGVTCRDSTGSIPPAPDAMVEVLIQMKGDVYTYPHTEGQFTSGPSMESLYGEMEKAERVCSGKASCQANYAENTISV